MFGAGQLCHKITVQRATEASNPLNEQVPTFADWRTFWSNRRDVSDGERRQGGDFGSYLESRFTIRWSSAAATITPKDRIVHNGWTWDIKGVKEPEGGHLRWIEITARTDRDVAGAA